MSHTPPPEGIDLAFPADSGCLGCSRTNPVGLGLRFRREGMRVVGEHALQRHFEGAPGVAHGGMLALLLDEYSCAAAYFLRGVLVVTGSLDVRYEAPCPVEAPLRIEAELESEMHPRYRTITARILHDGRVMARSTGRFFPAPMPGV
ncbi:MAG: PaaI family thioesterase [Polyangiaceae bacterium]|nr:PaaI family thioesterase [Polyangiaceae bacterium]